MKAAIESACAQVPTNSIIHVCEAVSAAIVLSIDAAHPSSIVCCQAQNRGAQYIARSRMFCAVFSAIQEVLNGHFGPAPGIDTLE